MPKKKKEDAIVLNEPVAGLKSSVINFGDLVIELHYDAKEERCYGVITGKAGVKQFSAEVK